MTTPTPDEAYAAYKQAPSKDSLYNVVKSVKPTIDYALSSVGANEDPVIRSHAELFTAKAIEKYDPAHAAGANLTTHIGHQLRQLSRTARAVRSPVQLPDRIQTEAYQLHQAKLRFQEENDREPDVLELADFTGMPVKKIEKIHRYQISIPSEAPFGGPTAETEPDYTQDALDYVYHDADHTDRQIMELKTGYGGRQVLSPQEVAAKLRLTPSQLSRRSMRLAARIQRMQDALEKI